jgi:tetratricopeptide (TPR) repeat protein
LALPDMVDGVPLETLTRFSALALFVERAQAVKTGFQLTQQNVPAVIELCRRLDGLPLAIEIAAAQVKYFSPQAILARLRDSLPQFVAPARDRPARQQTLHATIAWSYDLLTAEEQTLFTRLAVFRGGCTLEAAEAVCNRNEDLGLAVLAGLIALTDKSLLQQKQGQDGEPRFDMLETIHAYAQEQLGARGERWPCQQAHAVYYLALVEQAEPKLTDDESVQWLNRLEQDHDNLRCALRWALEDGQWHLALRMSGALREFWYTRGYFREGRQWLAHALQGSASVREEVAAKAIHAEGILAMAQGSDASALASLERARSIYQALGKQRELARVLHAIGNVHMRRRDYDRAAQFYDQALRLFQALDDPRGIGDTIHNLGMIAFCARDYQTARGYLEEGLSSARRSNFAQGIALSLVALGSTAYWERKYPEAIRYYKESLTLNQQLNDQDSLVLCLESLGFVAHDRDDFETAARLFGATSTLRERLGLCVDASSHDTQQQMIERGRTRHQAQWDAWWSAGRAMTTEQIIEYVHTHLHERR